MGGGRGLNGGGPKLYLHTPRCFKRSPMHPLPLPPSELGESPFWHPHEKRLYWCDIQGFALHAWEPATGRSWRWEMPGEPGCCARAPDRHCVIGLRDGFHLLDTASGALRCLAPLPAARHDPRRLRLNDGRCDTAGRFWAGSMVTPRTAPDAALWRLSAGAGGYPPGQMAGGNFTAHGLAFSPDDRFMYWSNTPEHRIDRFDFDAATGAIGKRQPWAHFVRKEPGQPYGGRPDGAAVDRQGNYWVAMYEGACVLQLAPTGAGLPRIATPGQCPPMVGFGGGKMGAGCMSGGPGGGGPSKSAMPALRQAVCSAPGSKCPGWRSTSSSHDGLTDTDWRTTAGRLAAHGRTAAQPDCVHSLCAHRPAGTSRPGTMAWVADPQAWVTQAPAPHRAAPPPPLRRACPRPQNPAHDLPAHDPPATEHRAPLPRGIACQRHRRLACLLRGRGLRGLALSGHHARACVLSQTGTGVGAQRDHAHRPPGQRAAGHRRRPRGRLLPLRLDAQGRTARQLRLRGPV